jgi:8-oxo-dGTP diphosphatase
MPVEERLALHALAEPLRHCSGNLTIAATFGNLIGGPDARHQSPRHDPDEDEGTNRLHLMSQKRHREVSCVIVVDTQGNLLLQQRDDISGILQPGKIALFGGHREAGETYLECAVREFREELSLHMPPQSFELLFVHDGEDLDAEGGTIYVEFFVVRGVLSKDVKVMEGALLILKPKDFQTMRDRFSPLCASAIQTFLQSK